MRLSFYFFLIFNIYFTFYYVNEVFSNYINGNILNAFISYVYMNVLFHKYS